MSVLNGWMLLGLTAVIAPLLIHLFARQRPPVLDWGAMQFLPTTPQATRALTIDDFWLMVLRATVLAFLALALARPWLETHGWANWNQGPPRDVAVILDGSFSTTARHNGQPIQDRLHHAARHLIEGLATGSTVQIYDARDAVVPLLPQRSISLPQAMAVVPDLAPPTGTSNLPAAIAAACRDLLDGQHPHRDIVVFTDGQGWPWRVDDSAAWESVDHQLRQAATPPRITAIHIETDETEVDDVGWKQARITHERIVPGQSVTLEGTLENGASRAQQRRVWCLLNGRPVTELQKDVRISPEKTTTVSFEVRVPTAGQHALSLRSDSDALPGNDRVDFIVDAVTGVKVLLVDGTPAAEPVHSEVFFASAALEPSTAAAGWIRTTTVPFDQITLDALADTAVVILANVPDLSPESITHLQQFVTRGGTVLLALGDHSSTTNTAWNAWLPATLDAWHDPAEQPAAVTHVAEDSLTVPWLQRFRPAQGGALCEAEFRGWWSVTPTPGEGHESALILARFANGDPWLVSCRRGLGTVVVATSPLDADGNTLPAKPDYVAWLHELLLAISAPAQPRNIAAGDSFALPPSLRQTSEVHGLDPWGRSLNLTSSPNKQSILARWPGVYVFANTKDQPVDRRDPPLQCGSTDIEAFAVQTDGRESDRTLLTAAHRQSLSAGRPLRFIDDVENWRQQSAADAPRTEISWWLLWAVLIGLAAESLLTCRRRRAQ